MVSSFCTPLRDALTPPVPPTSTPQPARIYIKHPDYISGRDTLVELECFDTDNSAPPQHGIQHAFALDLCAVITGNRFDCWLSRCREHATAINDALRQLPPSALLPSGTYFCHLPPGISSPVAAAATSHVASDATSALRIPTSPYPIVPNFRQWQFPPDYNLPRHWQKSLLSPITMQVSAKTRDSTCRLTDQSLSAHTSHIIPQAERSWFEQNDMSRYRLASAPGEDILDAQENTMVLRMDIHKAWDEGKLSLVPKHDVQTDTWCWAAHANHPAPHELRALYHNVRTHPLRGIPVQYLFARFAYDMFPLLRTFLHSSQPRQLLLHSGLKLCDSIESAEFTQRQVASRSRSPKKRQGQSQGCSPPKRGPGYNATHRNKDDRRQQRETSCGNDEVESRSDSGIGSFSLGIGCSSERISDELDNTDDGEGWEEDDEDARTACWLREQEDFERSLELEDRDLRKKREADIYNDLSRGRKRTRLD